MVDHYLCAKFFGKKAKIIGIDLNPNAKKKNTDLRFM